MLAACTARAHRVNANIFGSDFDVDVLGLRQYRYSRRRRVNPPLILGFRHALYPVHSGLEFHARKNTLAANAGYDFLKAAGVGLARRQNLDLPTLEIRIALIH